MVKLAFLGPQLVKNRQPAIPPLIQLLQVGRAVARPSQGQQLVPSIAKGSLATMLTIGGRLVGGGSPGRMVMFTAGDTFEAPTLSVATAVKAYEPVGGLLQTSINTLVGQIAGQLGPQAVRHSPCPRPRLFVPSKNSTLATVPSRSWA